jgi:dipeptidyl-peptidase 4
VHRGVRSAGGAATSSSWCRTSASPPLERPGAPNLSAYDAGMASNASDVGSPITFPRQDAVTRGFRLGTPRAFVPSPDGRRVAFIRSAGGRDAVGSLWVAEADGRGRLVERLAVDARLLVRADGDIPEAEKARRERMRETTAGITAYSADLAVTRAAFSLDGIPYVVDLDAAHADAVELPHPGPVVDPRMSPDGSQVAFVCDGSLFVVPCDGPSDARAVCRPAAEHTSWGLVDFIAAEELERSRGHWWLPDSSALLVEHVDETPVEVRWIADPAHPEREPRAHRYPAAGTANPVARLFRVGLDGSQREIAWDQDAYPYLATVLTHGGGAVVSVLSRDQTRQLILDVATDGSWTVARERVTSPWITIQAGVPCRSGDGRLLEIVANVADDCFQLLADDRPLTPPGLNVTSVADASGGRIVITAQSEPTEEHVATLDAAGALTWLTSGASVHAVAAGEGGLVIASADAERTGTTFEARLAAGSGDIACLAEEPVCRPVLTFRRVTERDLSTVVLWPTGHLRGSGRLPVVMSPYGGPHHARVRQSASRFAADQWLADQGFAVVVVDGRGTPGRGPAWEFAVSGDLAAGVLQDQVDALHALARIHPDLDLARVGITGWSFGGYLAALAVLDRPDVFHAAVAGAPVTEWRLYDTAYTERYLGLPQDRSGDYDASSLLPRAALLERPLLLVHGIADDNVIFAHTLQLSGALLAAGRPHAVLPLSGVTHMTPQEVVTENLLRLQVHFLRERLAAGT